MYDPEVDAVEMKLSVGWTGLLERWVPRDCACLSGGDPSAWVESMPTGWVRERLESGDGRAWGLASLVMVLRAASWWLLLCWFGTLLLEFSASSPPHLLNSANRETPSSISTLNSNSPGPSLGPNSRSTYPGTTPRTNHNPTIAEEPTAEAKTRLCE